MGQIQSRQIEGKYATGAGSRFHGDVASVLGDDGIGRRQPQAVAPRLGGEVGIEDPGEYIVGNATTVVADRDPHSRIGLPRNGKIFCAALR